MYTIGVKLYTETCLLDKYIAQFLSFSLKSYFFIIILTDFENQDYNVAFFGCIFLRNPIL